MAERAVYLVDEVLPQVSVRQWVLTLPLPERRAQPTTRSLKPRLRRKA